MQRASPLTDPTLRDTLPAARDSAEFATVLRAGSLPVPLRVTEVRTYSPTGVLVPAAGLLVLGLGLGFVLGHWWRGRRAR
jgi:preprotein translocase subunit SecD